MSDEKDLELNPLDIAARGLAIDAGAVKTGSLGPLDDLGFRMTKAQLISEGDPEVGHEAADLVLCDLVQVLSATRPRREQIEAIVEIYQDVRKLYA